MNNSKTKALALERGGLLVVALKFIFAVALTFLAVADKNTRFLTEHPLKVVSEAFVVGAGSAAAFAFIGWNRNAMTGIGKVLVAAFLVFFGVHFLLELSGFNEIEETTGSKKLAEASAKVKKSITAKFIFFLVALTLIMFTLCGWDTPFGIPPASATWRIKGLLGFLVEGAVFALCSALPFIMIVKDRKGHTSEAMKEFVKYFFVFFAGHFCLQYGGLYREAGFMGQTHGN